MSGWGGVGWARLGMVLGGVAILMGCVSISGDRVGWVGVRCMRMCSPRCVYTATCYQQLSFADLIYVYCALFCM